MGQTRRAEVPPQADATRSQERALVETVLRAEAEGILATLDQLGPSLHQAIDLLDRCAESGGTVLVTGLGKSGLVGAKISATLASLGIPSHAVHPSEAAHGDLGRFRTTDTVLCLSNSGETDEVVNLAAILRQDGLPIIAIVGPTGAASTLARLATVVLTIAVGDDAASDRLVVPTCTTTAAMALGDAMALALAHRRRVSEQDLARRHPGGTLGGLLRPVTELLRFRAGDNLPLVWEGLSVSAALAEAARMGRRPGAILLTDRETGRLTGLFTDGDLRRLVLRDPEELSRPIAEVMTRHPRTLPADALVRDAVRLFRQFRQDEIPVVDDSGRAIGLLDVQDLIAMRLVHD